MPCIRIDHNQIGDESAPALTAILKETQMISLWCAATASDRFCVTAR